LSPNGKILDPDQHDCLANSVAKAVLIFGFNFHFFSLVGEKSVDADEPYQAWPQMAEEYFDSARRIDSQNSAMRNREYRIHGKDGAKDPAHYFYEMTCEFNHVLFLSEKRSAAAIR